jgi:hypothetical protein
LRLNFFFFCPRGGGGGGVSLTYGGHTAAKPGAEERESTVR